MKRSGFKRKEYKPMKRTPLRKTAGIRLKSDETLKSKLDTLFSLYVRQRDSKDGVARCVTCGKYDHWKEMDAGHYISRQYLSVRYNEKNVHAQCKSCNRFHEGMKDAYALFLIKTYGKGILEELDKDKWKPVYNFPYEAMIEKYRQMV